MKNSNEKEAELPMYSNWNVEYPIKLSVEQKYVLNELTALNVKFNSKDKEFYNLVDQLTKSKLPPLAKWIDLEITDRHFRNISKKDVLIIVAHITGRDLAVRTHWLKTGQSIKRSAMGSDLVYPKLKD
ncbi:MAG: hypothetical protein GY707_15470 [Desulfobacteraceae bacterium]|nr:hypothetical protein [Desulfobacteraceae bacterium]